MKSKKIIFLGLLISAAAFGNVVGGTVCFTGGGNSKTMSEEPAILMMNLVNGQQQTLSTNFTLSDKQPTCYPHSVAQAISGYTIQYGKNSSIPCMSQVIPSSPTQPENYVILMGQNGTASCRGAYSVSFFYDAETICPADEPLSYHEPQGTYTSSASPTPTNLPATICMQNVDPAVYFSSVPFDQYHFAVTGGYDVAPPTENCPSPLSSSLPQSLAYHLSFSDDGNAVLCGPES